MIAAIPLAGHNLLETHKKENIMMDANPNNPTAQTVKIEMPRFQCHKKVWALKIAEVKLPAPNNDDGTRLIVPDDDRYAPFVVDAEYVRKHNPAAGGYYVVYEDGYKSFSPAKAFEDGYALLRSAEETARELEATVAVLKRHTAGPNVLTVGHLYELPNFEHRSAPGQKIQFIEKVQDPNRPPGNLKTLHDGTTNEAVLEVLIDRIAYLNGKFPCRENSIALTHIETALLWLNKRTADRLKRGVEGKAAA